ncbi:FAD-binding oxidoreductase [Nocardioides sp. zg-1228]|uniref:NAD(P)/FAD-dependent oxidoreductase n=1 Tax=Nocardioides sp. zg-1228 TaxID=2763008 RepID=UPI001642DF67|nr:FAD-binding oxidoreductase [Nocardioides sp. zg-1228]MBC2934809.1 FAD-dependent oxidoreductase [Nocardioides sp. zg-1228]QSF58400.1 FAD-dependent oxidoreductase [Nocardioides sp. zg-1228]
MRNGGVSFWWQQVGLPSPTDHLAGDASCDVAIVGGGLTGLWTAFYLAEADPTLDVRVVEAKFAGFGASGRNGGWLSSELAGSPRAYAAVAGEDGVRRLREALRSTVGEVIGVAAREGIEADIVRSGVLTVARSEAQRRRLGGELTAAQVAERVRVAGAVAGHFDPDCARVQPARLVAGVARAVRARGVRIHEGTRATSVTAGTVVTDRGTLTAPVVLRCLEGFTAGLPGHRRDWLPMNSAIVVTEPLDRARWDEIGWSGAELLGDEAHAYCYAQRTADGRIAMGGRGVPYRFGSRTDVDGRTQPQTVESLRSTLTTLFPSLAGVRLDHAWCGVLGVPRDWSASVAYDPATGLGHAGGYVGSGLTATNLAGRTLRDLVLGHDTDLTRLPWSGHRVRRWEPEPLRWAGVHALYGLYRTADRREDAGLGRTSRIARVAHRVAGR